MVAKRYFVYNIIASLSSPGRRGTAVSDPAGQINTIVLVTMAKSCDSFATHYGLYERISTPSAVRFIRHEFLVPCNGSRGGELDELDYFRGLLEKHLGGLLCSVGRI